MEFVALAGSMPGKLKLRLWRCRNMALLPAEVFRLAAGIDYTHVPYKGAPDIVLALPARGRFDVGFPTMPTPFGPAQQGTFAGAGGDQRKARQGDAGCTYAPGSDARRLRARCPARAWRHPPARHRRSSRGSTPRWSRIEGPGVPQLAGQRDGSAVRVQQPSRILLPCCRSRRPSGKGPDHTGGRA